MINIDLNNSKFIFLRKQITNNNFKFKIMKKVVKTILTLVLFVSMIHTTIAQNLIVDISREIRISGLSVNKNIEIDVSKESKTLVLNIACEIYSGSVSVEIYNPKGDKKGNFTIKSIVNDGESVKNKPFSKSIISEKVSGRIGKQFKVLTGGKWSVKIIPNKAYGVINIENRQLDK